jgi:hypothetical protein
MMHHMVQVPWPHSAQQLTLCAAPRCAPHRSEGGTSIEDLAEKFPDKIIKIPVDIRQGITDEQVMRWRVVRCGVVCCGAAWCGVVWCGVVWCDSAQPQDACGGQRPCCARTTRCS